MTQTYESWYVSTLAKKLSSTDTSIEVATAPTVTSWRLYITDWAQEAWCNFTWVTWTTLTWVTFVSNTADPATTASWKTFIAWTKVSLVAMHDQLFDKQQDQTLPKSISFSWTTNSWIRVSNLTTTQRNALSSPANWMIVYDTTAWEFYIYQGWAWSVVSSWSTQPNASETVAWKVQKMTTAQSKSGIDTWSTWAFWFVVASDIAANTQSWTFLYWVSTDVNDTYTTTLTPTLTAYTIWMKIKINFTTANTWACTLNIDSLWAKNIKQLDWKDPVTWAISASGIHEFIYDWTNFVLQNPAKPNIKFAWNWSDWVVIDADLTITGSDNTYIIKNYSSWTAWSVARTCTVTPIWCIVHLKIQWDADFTNWTFNFAWKWWQGWTGWATQSTLSTAWNDWNAWTWWIWTFIWFTQAAGGQWGWLWWSYYSAASWWSWANLENNWTAWQTTDSTKPAGWTSPVKFFSLAWTMGRKAIIIMPWLWWWGGGSWGTWWTAWDVWWAGWNGWNGWGCLIFEVWGNLTLSSTTITCAWTNWTNWIAWWWANNAWGWAWWSWGAWWHVLIMYNWTLTWTVTPTVTWWSWWSWGAAVWWTFPAWSAWVSWPNWSYLIVKNISF